VRDLDPAAARQVAIEVKFFLQLQRLVTGVRRPRPLGVSTVADGSAARLRPAPDDVICAAARPAAARILPARRDGGLFQSHFAAFDAVSCDLKYSRLLW